MILEIQGLSHNFGPHAVLRDLTFSLEAGAFAFLTGPSGSGKTTLLRLLHGSLSLQEGRAVAAGHDLAGLPPSRLHRLRRDVSIVFQDFRILPDRTVRDNVALPLVVRGLDRDRIIRRVASALIALGLEAVADRPAGELAGGERQRVAIARAVVAGPKLMLADEPTGSLDDALALRILGILRQFADHGTTVLMATHSPALIAAVPDAAVLRLPGAAPSSPAAGQRSPS